MLLGTHPIPARSPAEREGQIRERDEREENRQEDSEGGMGSLWAENRDK